MLLSFYVGEEIFQIHDLKEVVKEYCNKHKHNWEYNLSKWEEEEIHYGAQTYEEVISRHKGKPLGRI
jgi:hypothetical protein